MSISPSERAAGLGTVMFLICLLGTCLAIFLALDFSALAAGDSVPL